MEIKCGLIRMAKTYKRKLSVRNTHRFRCVAGLPGLRGRSLARRKTRRKQRGGGIFRETWPNGNLKSEGNIVGGKKGLFNFWPEKGKKDGVWREWYENGDPRDESLYENGVKNGVSKHWYQNGQQMYEGVYVDGTRDGLWKWWIIDGTPRADAYYVNGINVPIPASIPFVIEGPKDYPADAEDVVTFEPIKEGDTTVNMGNEYENERYYLKSTWDAVTNKSQYPWNLPNVKFYTAHIIVEEEPQRKKRKTMEPQGNREPTRQSNRLKRAKTRRNRTNLR